MKIKHKIGFFAIFSSLIHYFPVNLHWMIAWSNVQLLAFYKKKRNSPYLGPMILNQAQNEVFHHIPLSLEPKFSLKLNMMIACNNI